MATQKVKVRIEADGKQASREIKKTQKAFSNFGSSLKKGLVIGAAAAAAGIFALVKVMKSAVTAANVQEDAIRKLDAALVKMGPSADRVSQALQDQAAALQKVTKFGDETIISGQALIASFTDNEQKIKDATEAALNLAAATGTELKAAFLLMGRAAAGETSTLSRYGITLEEGLSSSEKFAAAIKKINDQFGGQAQAQAETFTGKIAQLSNAYGDLLEKVGQAITENDKITATLTKLKDLLTSGGLVDGVEKFAEALGKFVTKTADAVQKIPALVAGIKDFTAGIGENISLLRKHNTHLDAFLKILEFSITGYGRLTRALIAVGETRQKLDQISRQNLKTEELLARRFELQSAQMFDLLGFTGQLNSARKAAVAGTDALSFAELRLQRILKDEAKELETLKDVAKELGIVLERDLAAALEKAADQVEIARAAAQSGVGEWEDYDRVVKATGESIEALKAELSGVAVEAQGTSTSIDRLGTSGSSASLAINALNSALVVSEGNLSTLSEAIVFTAKDFDRLADSAGRAAATTAAVAGGATLVQGGSRIRFGFPGGSGGSRLTGSPLLSDISVTLSGGTFTTITQPVQATPDGGLVFN